MVRILIIGANGFMGHVGEAHKLAVVETTGTAYYGETYQDMSRRVPDISCAAHRLGWTPQVPLRDGLRRMMTHYIGDGARDLQAAIRVPVHENT